MGVKGFLIIATAFLVSVMLFDGLYQKDSPLMWLASAEPNYAYMRAALVVVLLTLLVSSPPRSLYFRQFLGLFAAALFGSTIWLSATYTINLLDAVIFTEVAIIFMIEALEAGEAKVRHLGSKISAAK
jgi:hypothetical protein